MALSFDFDKQIERRGTESYKWDDTERLFGRPGVLPFWVADMDFATPQPILDAISKRTEHPILGYGYRTEEYFSSVESWLARRHRWKVQRDWLMFCPPGPIVALQGILECLTSPGDSVVVPTPTYGPLISIVEQNDRKLIRVPYIEVENRYMLDLQTLESSLEPGTRLVLLCSPNNPTGRVHTRDELQALAGIAARNDLVVVSDEVHCDLVLPGHTHVPYGAVGDERSVTVISPNKTFNSAGIPQASLVIPNAKIREKFNEFLIRMQLSHDSCFGALGMMAAYQHGEAWLDEVIQYIAANHRFVADFLDAEVPGVKAVHAEATYLAWLDFRESGISQDELMQRLVQKGGVALYSGTDFGAEGEGFFRMNIACSRSMLEQGLKGITQAVG